MSAATPKTAAEPPTAINAAAPAKLKLAGASIPSTTCGKPAPNLSDNPFAAFRAMSFFFLDEVEAHCSSEAALQFREAVRRFSP